MQGRRQFESHATGVARALRGLVQQVSSDAQRWRAGSTTRAVIRQSVAPSVT